jgi:hypothetical protein
MRELVVPIAFLALGVAACGTITGLNGYSEGASDAATGVDPQSGSSGGERGDDANGDVSEMTSDDDTSDAVAVEETGDDGPTSDDGIGSDDAEPSDASSTTADATVTQDAGGEMGGHDAAPEAALACSASNCTGCCRSGACETTGSATTCGTGGVACQSCSGSTPVCSGGSCVAEPMEASTPTCTPSGCPICIALVYTQACCTSSNVCGCQVDIPSLGPCMPN